MMIEDDADFKRLIAPQNDAEVQEVLERVAEHFRTTVDEVLSKSNEQLPVAARQAVIKVLHEHYGYSFARISRALHQHQTTVQHAFHKPMHTRTRQAVIAALRAA